MKGFISLLGAFAPFAWPTVVLILVLYFRRSIQDRLQGLFEAQVGNNVF